MTTATAIGGTNWRRLPFRMRGDLVARPLVSGGRRGWAIKDPLSLRYYQLQEEEYRLLQMLDGNASLEGMKAAFERQFAPYRLSARQLHSFLAMLHREGLVIADGPAQGAELIERRSRLRRQAIWQGLASLLAIRFRGVDPRPVLRWLEPRTRWVFSTWFLACCGLLVAAALTNCLAQWETMRARLPEFHAFFTADNLLWLAVAVAGCKALHELGHMLTCRHFGAECHSLGVMLLVFAPCLYCDVSDAWMLSSKWQRAAVGAAGIFVELVLAALASFVWWSSEPGLLHTISFDVMLACSINTLLFNGNPLLRYDGYYVLADLIDVPNLQQRASGVVRGAIMRWWLGIDLDDGRFLPEKRRGLLALYGLASVAYRWFLTLAIIWLGHQALKPYGLEVLATLLGAVVLAGLISVPAWQATRFVEAQLAGGQVDWQRAAWRGGGFLVAVVCLLTVPLPYRLHVPAMLEPRDAHRIYVSVPGILRKAVSAGQQVAEGQTLAELESREVALEMARLRGKRNQQRLHVQNLKLRQVNEPTVGAELPAAQEALADLEQRLVQLLRDQKRLTLAAPAAGTVLPPHEQNLPVESGRLPAWSGTPLEERNLGSFLETGTLVCLVGDPDRLDAALIVDQSEIELVRGDQAESLEQRNTGLRVRIELDETPSGSIWGTVAEIAELDLKVAPRELVARAKLPVRTDESGVARPFRTSYLVRVTLDEHAERLLSGTAGQAKIYLAPRSLLARIARFVSSTFRP